jgi:hypothetical protein
VTHGDDRVSTVDEGVDDGRAPFMAPGELLLVLRPETINGVV